MRLFDPSTGEPLQTLEGHESRVRSLDYAWVGEGKLLPQLVSVSSDGVVLVWDPSTTSKCTGRKKSNARLTAVVCCVTCFLSFAIFGGVQGGLCVSFFGWLRDGA